MLFAVVAVAGVVASSAPASGHSDAEAAPLFGIKVPFGYRDWRLISVAHEEGDLNDIRAILGNNPAIRGYREEKLPFPDGTIIAPNSLELLPLGARQQSLWPPPIFRSRGRPGLVRSVSLAQQTSFWPIRGTTASLGQSLWIAQIIPLAVSSSTPWRIYA